MGVNISLNKLNGISDLFGYGRLAHTKEHCLLKQKTSKFNSSSYFSPYVVSSIILSFKLILMTTSTITVILAATNPIVQITFAALAVIAMALEIRKQAQMLNKITYSEAGLLNKKAPYAQRIMGSIAWRTRVNLTGTIVAEGFLNIISSSLPGHYSSHMKDFTGLALTKAIARTISIKSTANFTPLKHETIAQRHKRYWGIAGEMLNLYITLTTGVVVDVFTTYLSSGFCPQLAIGIAIYIGANLIGLLCEKWAKSELSYDKFMKSSWKSIAKAVGYEVFRSVIIGTAEICILTRLDLIEITPPAHEALKTIFKFARKTVTRFASDIAACTLLSDAYDHFCYTFLSNQKNDYITKRTDLKPEVKIADTVSTEMKSSKASEPVEPSQPTRSPLKPVRRQSIIDEIIALNTSTARAA